MGQRGAVTLLVTTSATVALFGLLSGAVLWQLANDFGSSSPSALRRLSHKPQSTVHWLSSGSSFLLQILGLQQLNHSGREGAAWSLQDVASWSDAELSEAAALIEEVRRSREFRQGVGGWTAASMDAHIATSEVLQNFRYAHKKTYATADPIGAAYFLENYFGAKADRSPFQHHCANTSLEQPLTKNANFPKTKDQPNGFTIHFVKNPQKAPQSKPMNPYELGRWVEQWRGNFSTTNKFDQFMDNHLGFVFDSLDPLVERWQRDGVPFICRTWCCGPGMPQWPNHCPKDERFNTFFCEQGCYIEVPYGIIVEALCGLESYTASRSCLTKIQPEQLQIFDLCADS